MCNEQDGAKTYVITEIDLSQAPGNQGGHIADRRPDVYAL